MTYEDRTAEAGRVAARAEQLLNDMLVRQGRLPGSYDAEEYIAALEAAAVEARASPKPMLLPPRDAVALSVVHGTMRAAGLDPERLAAHDPAAYLEAYAVHERCVYGLDSR